MSDDVRIGMSEYKIARKALLRYPALLEKMDRASVVVVSLSEEDKERVREALASEIAESGVSESGDITGLGKRIDDLIDLFAVE